MTRRSTKDVFFVLVPTMDVYEQLADGSWGIKEETLDFLRTNVGKRGDAWETIFVSEDNTNFAFDTQEQATIFKLRFG